MLQTEPHPLSPARLAQLDPSVRAHPTPGPVVYYLSNLLVPLSSPVKIGTTGNLPLRVEQLQRQTGQVLALLAWETGSYELEQRRHVEFTGDRIAGSEWFWQSFPLLDHLARLGAPPGAHEPCLHSCPEGRCS